MLKEMRGFTRGWIARGILVILGLSMAIVVTQGQVDILNMLSGFTGPRGVAEVYGRDISPQELSRTLDNTLKNMREPGQTVTRDQAIAQNIHMALLEQLIERKGMHVYADKLGVKTDDHQVAEAIRNIPGLRSGVGGGFDEAAYARVLQEAGYASTRQFEDEARGDIAAGMLVRAMSQGVRAPASYGALVIAFESETRTISLAEAPASLVGTIPQPTATQIQAFYEDNAQNLQMPEYRALTIVYARAADFAVRVNIPEQRLREEFDARRQAMVTPERRTYRRFAATSEQQARDIVARLGRGESPEAIQRALNVTSARLENQTQQQIGEPEVRAAVFSMAVNAPARAARAQLTPWTVVKVESITPAQEPNYTELRPRILEEMQRAEASERMDTAATAFEDARAGGTPIAEAARAQGFEVVNVPAVDARGLTPQGQPAEQLVDQAELIQLAFETPEGEASEFTPIGDADVIVSVDRVTPPARRPLEDVRPQLIAAWIARERAQRLDEIGERVQQAVRGGQSFADAVRANRLVMRVPSQAIDRRAASQLPARGLAASIFNAQPRDVVQAVRADGQTLVVVQVQSVQRADPATVRPLIEQARVRMQQSLGEGLVEAITKEVVRQGHARRNENLIRQTFRRADAQDQQQQ